MNDDTTIIIITRNNYKNLSNTIIKLKEYMTKYHNTQETIIIDNNSKDGTAILLQKIINEPKFTIITNNKHQTEKTNLIKALETSRTPNIITLEPELYTRLHQIQRQIKKLRKAHLIIPNRFNKHSKTRFKNKKEELKNKTKNYLINLITKIDIIDINNKNKAFKKGTILNIIKNTKTKQMYWVEVIKKCKKKGLRITQCKTHHIQEETIETDKTTLFFQLIKELFYIKKKK